MLTYDEIVNIEFPKGTFGGYKSDSVDDYIDDVADTVKTLLEQIKNLTDKVNELNAQIQEYKNTESSLHAALVIAQETGQKLVNDATQKAEDILKAAEENAAAIILDAENNARTLVDSTSADSSELLKKSKEKASEILREALVKANSITQKAKENCANEEAKYEDLKKKVSDFRTSMLLLYRSHVELLNEMKAEPEQSTQNDEFSEHHTVDEATENIVVSDELTHDVVSSNDVPDESVKEEKIEENLSVEDKIENIDEDLEVEEIDLNKISFDNFSDSSDNNESQVGFDF